MVVLTGKSIVFLFFSYHCLEPHCLPSGLSGHFCEQGPSPISNIKQSYTDFKASPSYFSVSKMQAWDAWGAQSVKLQTVGFSRVVRSSLALGSALSLESAEDCFPLPLRLALPLLGHAYACALLSCSQVYK